MSNYNSKKGKKGRIFAGVLCGVLALVAVAGAGTSLYMGIKENGWFSKQDDVEDETPVEETTETVSGALVTMGESRGIKLLSTSLGATANSYTLTAEYNDDASTPYFTWTSSNNTAVTVTPSSDTLSATVTCNGAFSTQVTITCAYAYDTTVYATCTVDYYKRLDSSTTFAMRYTNSASTSYQQTNTLDVSGQTGIDSYTITLPDYDSLYFYTAFTPTLGTGTIYEGYTIKVDLYSYITTETFSTSYSSTYGGSVASLSASGAILANDVFCDYVFGYTGTTDSSLNSCYQAWSSANATYDIKVTITVTGLSTGEVSTCTTFFKFDMSNLVVPVSSVDLNQSSIAF